MTSEVAAKVANSSVSNKGRGGIMGEGTGAFIFEDDVGETT